MSTAMKPYVIRQGDHLDRLADRYGFDADAVWDHPRNEPIRTQRDDFAMLRPGDVLFIPVENQRPLLDLRARASNQYVARIPRAYVSLIVSQGGASLADQPYVILGLGEDDVVRRTTADGAVEFEAPVHLREVTVRFEERSLEFRIGIGELDPPNTPSGMRTRLQHLGYYSSAAPAPGRRRDAELRNAIRWFQAYQDLEVTGEMDTATIDAVVAAHQS